MKIPSTIIAGDSIAWRDDPGLDALGASVDSGAYSAKYVFRGPQPAGNLDLALTAYGPGWQGSLTSAQTLAFNTLATRQMWYWQMVATKVADPTIVVSLGSGQLVVRPSLTAAALGQPFDGRTQAEQDLSVVQAAIRAREAGDLVTKYTIGTRSLEKEPIEKLLVSEQRLKRIVARERRAQMIANGLGNPGRVGVRFR